MNFATNRLQLFTNMARYVQLAECENFRALNRVLFAENSILGGI